MNHEHNIHNILENWNAPVLKTDFTDRVLARMDTQQKTTNKFKFAWAAMILVIFMNVAVAINVLKEDNEYKTNIYTNYFETTRQELVNDEITE